MDIRKIPLADMVIAPYNPRKTLKEGDIEYEKLKKSIDEFGYLQLIVWNEATGNVVGGNQKAQIFKDEGRHEAEAIVINEPDLLREKIINTALNKISGQWDADKLKIVLDELLLSDIDATLTGFDLSEIDLITIPEDIFTETGNFDLYSEYKEPEKKQLRCPKCSHIDGADRFVKV